MGFRCGYVGIDETHPYYGRDYCDEGVEDINCHWGLTYSDKAYFEESDLWYLGFDCGHCCDIPDTELALEYGVIDEKQYTYLKSLEEIYRMDEDSSVKNVDFVRENCKMIVEQLILIKNKESAQ
jgi:hypothetical protein